MTVSRTGRHHGHQGRSAKVEQRSAYAAAVPTNRSRELEAATAGKGDHLHTEPGYKWKTAGHSGTFGHVAAVVHI